MSEAWEHVGQRTDGPDDAANTSCHLLGTVRLPGIPEARSQSVPDSDVTVEYCAEHNWLVGSPDTVAEKIEQVYEDVGGFGQMLVFGFDYLPTNPDVWHKSLNDAQERGRPDGRSPRSIEQSSGCGGIGPAVWQ